LGFMTAIGIIFLSMILSNTFQKEEDVERELGLPSLGVIPKFKGDS
jgi:capsular polysaccharide biosynthesis protein